jgi:hypothetical protein
MPKLWGAAAIGAAIDRSPSQTHRLLITGKIKCARRVGRRWMADSDELDLEFTATPRLSDDAAHAAANAAMTAQVRR